MENKFFDKHELFAKLFLRMCVGLPLQDVKVILMKIESVLNETQRVDATDLKIE